MPNLFDPWVIIETIPELLRYLPITLIIAVFSLFFSLILGFATALVKIHQVPVLRRLADFYVSYMRGTPLLVQLYIAYYGIPILLEYMNFYMHTDFSIGAMPKIVFVIVAFSFNEGAYISEILRAAIESVDEGQLEAAYSIGMSYPQAFIHIVLPEAMIVAIPSLGNQFISLIKGTSLAFVCAVIEMTAAGRLVSSRNLRFFETYIALSIIYWAITIILSRILIMIEKKLKKSKGELHVT